MKNNIKRIIDFYDGALSEGDNAKFENELKNSEQLKLEADKVKRVKEFIESTGSIKADSHYFATVIPAFRRKNIKRSGIFIPRFAYQLAVSLSAFLITFLFWYQPEVEKSESGIESYLDLYSDAAYEYTIPNDIASAADSALNTEISELLTAAAYQEYLYSDNYHELITSLSEREAELVYEELIFKEIVE